MELSNPERLFGLDKEMDRRLPRVRSLSLIRDNRYEVWPKFIALYLRRLYLNNI